MAQLFRGMKESGGRPQIGASARTLGVRPGFDVQATGPGDLVHPGRGGLSVSPDSPMDLPEWRRPPELLGVGKDPVWVIKEEELGPGLCYRPDPDRTGHGFVEPSRSLTLDEFQEALGQTRERWRKVESWPEERNPSDAD